ncbi:cytochrome c [uncultured Limimaricola sp.]|uniref:c-type cytochrome n=1 Tax=uncultured Limimaricola sp. TaxID=2211667 RepID=UPI0030F7E063
MAPKRQIALAAALGLAALAGLGGLLLWPSASGAQEHGRQIYLDNCAACHGADREGQADWRRPGPSGRLPAPPHDETGHTWHHPDRVLRDIVLRGTAAIVGQGYESDMPGFEGVLSADEIEAVLDYLKSEWPDRERAFQEQVTETEAGEDRP